MKRITYVKDSGESSIRDVIPIGFIFGDRDKVMLIDLSDMSEEEREVELVILEDIHRKFLDDLYDSGYRGKVKTFFLDGIEDVE